MDPYIGEIKLWALNFQPEGWVFCDGRSLPVNQYQALYSLLGNYYGGDKNNFNLPDLRGRVPVHYGQKPFGTKGGAETVALTTQQVSPHTHPVAVFPNAGDKAGGLNNHIAAAVTKPPATNVNLYAAGTNTLVALNPTTVGNAGAGAGHNNMQPYLTLNYFIAITGLYPTRP
jgi:microcystin-dependent protein